MNHLSIECAHCGNTFTAVRKRKYCADQCANRAKYEKVLAKAPKCPICGGPHLVEGRNPRPACNKCYKAGLIDSNAAGEAVCRDCGKVFASQRNKKRQRCSQCQFERQKASAAAKGPCAVDGCDTAQFCKGMCSSHYWAQNNDGQPRVYPDIHKVCEFCGEDFTTKTSRTKYCSSTCGVRATVDTRQAARAANRSAEVCVYNAEHAQWLAEMKSLIRQSRIIQGKVNAAKSAKDRRSPIRQAYEDGDMPGLIQAIKDRCTINEADCWVWGGTVKKGYGRVNFGSKNHSTHRLSALARYGIPESETVVHHKCAITTCCNPDHLQPISQRENMAEMLQRNYYLRRIEELEAALHEVAPGHQVLARPALAA